jgi:hypothetical protein
MTPVTKQAWIDALRSGEFNQCTGALGKLAEGGGINYCCLGVLATLAGAQHRIDPDDEMNILTFDFGGGAEDSGVIPGSLRGTIVSDLNLEQMIFETGLNREDDLMRTLSSKNDRGATFAEIADYLENLP